MQTRIDAVAPDHDRASACLTRASRAIIATLGVMALLIVLALLLSGAPYFVPLVVFRVAFLVTIVVLSVVVVNLRAQLAEHVRKSAVLTRRLNEAQRVARLGYWEMNATTREPYWSDGLYSVFGLEADGSPPMMDRVMALIHPEDRERMREVFERAGSDVSEFSEQYRLTDATGVMRVLQSTGRVIVDETGARKLVGTVQDITERAELESRLRQVQKMEAVGQLAGGVAHDFNNVLTVVDGYGALIAGSAAADDEIRDSVAEIRKAAKRAATLTRQLLAFSRKQAVRPRRLDLNETVAGTSTMLHRLIGDDVRLDTRLAEHTEPIIADPMQIEQILINLAVNARDAMPDGGTLVVETANAVYDRSEAERRGLSEAGKYVLLSVTDAGMGMDAATKARIFEPFFTTKGSGKGTGLGLATVYGIVRQAGGHVDVESEVGRGTRFTVYLPVEEGEGRSDISDTIYAVQCG